MSGEAKYFYEVKGLRKSFGDTEVLKGLDLQVRQGESIALLGTSGGGKSVFLKHLACLFQPTAGSIKIEGLEVVGLNEWQLGRIRQKIGMMFQGGALFDSLSVAENVAFPLVEEGELSKDEIEDKVVEVLDDVGLSHAYAKMPADISGGMRKRVALARAVVNEPKCLLYDEPGAGLDPVVADSIDYLIREIQLKRNTTSIVITHEISSIFKIADRVVFLKDGLIYWDGTPAEMKASDDGTLVNYLAGKSEENWDELEKYRRQ